MIDMVDMIDMIDMIDDKPLSTKKHYPLSIIH